MKENNFTDENGKIIDGWYYIKTWDLMEKDPKTFINYDAIGVIIEHIRFPSVFTERMENTIHPLRCVNIISGTADFVGDDGTFKMTITPWMIEAKAYKVGQEIEVSHDNKEWFVRKFVGYDYECGSSKYCSGPGYFKYAREPEEKKIDIEITVKVNGKECNLKDISEDTLLKIRNS